MIEHSHLGKGAIPDSPDERDYKAVEKVGAITPVDWTVSFSCPEPPSNDQNGSSSCVAQGWSYYHWQLRNKDFCRKDIYAWIFIPGGGAQIRDGGMRIIKFGQVTRAEVPDPTPETEAAMESHDGLNPALEKEYQELNSFVIPNDIDSVAAYIRDYQGVVGGVVGSDEGWQDLKFPRPPASGETTWGHCLYFFGYTIVNGVKYIIAKSSWGNAGNTTVHYIGENYFISGYTFNPWTLIPQGNATMNATIGLVNDNGTYYLVGELGKIGIADPPMLSSLQKITAGVSSESTSSLPQVGVLKSITPPITGVLVES